MFVQVIRGPMRPDSDFRALLDKWMQEVRPGAIGWLGMTAGITADGELLAMARFASSDEARRNSERPEQDAWWAEMDNVFAGPVTFHDCEEVALFLDGGSDDAGFVQVIESASDAPPTAKELAEASSGLIAQHRPDVLGGFVAVAGDGTVFDAVYFTSEAEARENEARPLPDDAQAAMDALMAPLGEPTYHDLSDPILVS